MLFFEKTPKQSACASARAFFFELSAKLYRMTIFCPLLSFKQITDNKDELMMEIKEKTTEKAPAKVVSKTTLLFMFNIQPK